METYLFRWVELSGKERSFEGLVDLPEQLIGSVSAELAVFSKKRQPGSMSAAAEIAEKYVEAHCADRKRGGGARSGSGVGDSGTTVSLMVSDVDHASNRRRRS